MTNFLHAKTSELGIHPEVATTYQNKNISNMVYTMKRFGQQQQITVVNKGGQLLVIDGVSRLKVACECNIPELFYELVDIDDHEVLNYRIRINQKLEIGVIEKCIQVEHILGIIGKSQGKKRESLGIDLEDSDEQFGLAGKDRFELACAILNIEMKASTLRKLMKVYWEETLKNETSESNILKLLDKGRISIDKAHSLVKEKEKKQEQAKVRSLRPVEEQKANIEYKLFNKSSMDLSEIPNETVRLAIQSPPYFQLRKYRNQDEMLHGQEKTVEEYIENQLRFCREIRKKLVSGGVLALIVGETYQNGYKGVCTKLETALEKDDWQILDVNIWVKTNPKPQPHPFRFLPSHEKVIVCKKKGDDPVFNEVTKPSSTGSYKAIRGTVKVDGTTNYSISSPEASITNVITTPVFNSKELKEIDPEFRHDAPCPLSIYEDIILAYSNPGEIVFDGFCGSGTGLDCALSKGRSAIGYDVDPESIKFCHKRLEQRMRERGNFRIGDLEQHLKAA